jgi:hypothetical protein
MSWIHAPSDYIMQFRGGREVFDVVVGEDQWPWPAPGILKGSDPGGQYVKDSETEIPHPSNPGATPIRVARYYWQKI